MSRAALAAAVAGLEARGNSSRDAHLVLQKWNTYDGFLADAEGEREKLESLVQKYPEDLPDVEEIDELKNAAEQLALANGRSESATLPAEKAARHEELSTKFKPGVPTDEDISSMQDTAAELIRLNAEITNLEGLTLGSSEHKFAVRAPEREEVKRYGDKLALLREKRAQPKKSTGKVLAIILVILAAASLGGGSWMIYIKNFVFGGMLLGAGALLVVAGLFTYFKGQLNGMSATATKEITDLENDIRSFLSRFGYYTDGGVEVDYNNLERDFEIYNLNRDEKEKNEVLLGEKRVAAAEAKSKLLTFLRRYGFPGENAQAELTRLGALAAEYVALNAEKEECDARKEASAADIEKLTQTVNGILEKYAIEQRGNPGGLASELQRDRAEYDRLCDNIERLEKRASDYREEHNLTERPETVEDVQSIDAELSRKREELSLLDRVISDDEGSVERLEELREELDNALAEESALKRKHALIVKTLELLEKAEQNLKDKYIFPVKNSFLSYSELLERVLGERVSFDKNFKVRFERGGEERSDAHLSAGQRSLCALCLRLALIDNMYKKEKPFIIMDDPFVHLDGEHMERAGKLLKELARGRQIIYFCCHESRKI